jgi:hypothetical protein
VLLLLTQRHSDSFFCGDKGKKAIGIITVNEQKTHSLGILTIFHFYCPTLRLLFYAETLGSTPVPNLFVIVRTKSHVGL